MANPARKVVAPTWVPTSTRQGKRKGFFEIHCREEPPTSVVGGVQSSTGTVTLSGPAPAGGAQSYAVQQQRGSQRACERDHSRRKQQRNLLR
jgi:hypothetical protein